MEAMTAMADGDYYARNLAPGWRKVGATIAGGQAFESVVDLAATAFGQTIRLGNGVPSLDALAAAFCIAAQRGDRAHWTAAGDEACRASRRHASTEMAVLAGQQLLETESDRLRSMSADERRLVFVEAAARRIAEHHLHRCLGGELPDTFGSMSELRAYQAAVRDALPIAELAAGMLAHEDGQGFRKPRRARPPKGTAAMIDVRLDGQ